jgi:hypothetical protein
MSTKRINSQTLKWKKAKNEKWPFWWGKIDLIDRFQGE